MQDFSPVETDDDAPAAPPSADMFSRQRALCAATRGAFFLELPNHVITYLPGTGQRLVVSWDNLAAFRDGGDLREPWGQTFLQAQGWDVMGVMIKRKDWYRDADLIAALESLRDDGLFRRFPAVSMYGSSMGAFAALAFAPVAPGCTVLAFAPQTSLDPAVVPFEGRYPAALRITDWSLPYSDAAKGVPPQLAPTSRTTLTRWKTASTPTACKAPTSSACRCATWATSCPGVDEDEGPETRLPRRPCRRSHRHRLRPHLASPPRRHALDHRPAEPRGRAWPRPSGPAGGRQALGAVPHWKLRHARKALYARISPPSTP